jgi:hypothetical protein
VLFYLGLAIMSSGFRSGRPRCTTHFSQAPAHPTNTARLPPFTAGKSPRNSGYATQQRVAYLYQDEMDDRAPSALDYLDFLFRSAQRCFIISEMRLREAALMWRRLRLGAVAAWPLPTGLPRRRVRVPSPSNAPIALSRCSRSLLSSANIFWISMLLLSTFHNPEIV